MIGLGLRQLQETLNRKADAVQHEFVSLSERLDKLSKLLLETRGEEHDKLKSEQKGLRARQVAVADEVNLWRQRARGVIQQRGGMTLRAYLEELLLIEDEEVREAVQYALHLMDAPPEELERLLEAQQQPQESKTPASRLLERARKEYDLRGTDLGPRLRAAVEFANRPGMALDLDTVAEMEAAMDDGDPLVREVAILTTIQLYRFRAMRTADLDVAHHAVQILARLPHAAVIPVLIEIVENPRSGYAVSSGETVEGDNNRSRMVALLRLVEWHTTEAQTAVRARKFDRDSSIVRAAERALELFPGEWAGPLQRPEKPA